MHEWRISYEDYSIVRGTTKREWLAAPDDGVQVVVLMRPPDVVRWTIAGRNVTDRELWTGDERYSVNGWPAKRGSLIADEDYARIVAEAVHAP